LQHYRRSTRFGPVIACRIGAGGAAPTPQFPRQLMRSAKIGRPDGEKAVQHGGA
jgi:hypothetical protein